MTTETRLPIRRVGTMRVAQDQVVFEGWGVPQSCDLDELAMPYTGADLGGWPVELLHDLTHGVPCVLVVAEGSCEVDAWLAASPERRRAVRRAARG